MIILVGKSNVAVVAVAAIESSGCSGYGYKKKAKVSGSSHSADDRSADVLLCENCQRMLIRSRLGMRGHLPELRNSG